MLELEKPEKHILGYDELFGVLLVLLVLTCLTVFAATLDFGHLNVWVALLIAASKGSLVVFFFMHLKYENKMLKIMLAITLFTLAIFIGFTFFDVAFR